MYTLCIGHKVGYSPPPPDRVGRHEQRLWQEIGPIGFFLYKRCPFPIHHRCLARLIGDSRFGVLFSASRFGAIRRNWRLAIRAIRHSTDTASLRLSYGPSHPMANRRSVNRVFPRSRLVYRRPAHSNLPLFLGPDSPVDQPSCGDLWVHLVKQAVSAVI